ncbi:MAG: type I 3-dehydroquinate dehydratase, partial [Sphaerochaetaceae bacterium]|nr:type I 3-dehydroquinate dehydratase [Sphaerochaetaceae bacterium]
PDLENEIAEKGIKIIRSYHNFSGMPDDLYGLVRKLKAKGDIPKVAVTPKTISDVTTLFKCEKELEDIKEKVIIGMGNFGVATRILYKRTGSLFTFCGDGNLANIGMVNSATLSNLYKANTITKETKIFGVIGNPVHNSHSPIIHNLGLQKLGLNAVYVPFHVDNVREFLKLADYLQMGGFSVTTPHKQNIIPYLARTSVEVTRIGACNTVVKEQSYWKGINTDYYSFVEQSNIDNRTYSNALVIGAGGGARAVVWALKNRRINVSVINRTLIYGKNLASETMSSYDSLENIGNYSGSAELIIHCTPVGMYPDIKGNIAPELTFTGNETVVELVYTPKETPFVKRALNAKCKVVYGTDLILSCAKLQFKAFTGLEYPTDLNPEI